MSLQVKMKIFNAVVLPVLMYEATACALTRTEEMRLGLFEMRMLRSIIGVRSDNYARNDDIRERLCQTPVFMKLRKARLNWFGHVERMGGERQVKKVLNAEMGGRRQAGRLRTREQDGTTYCEETWQAAD